MHKFSFCLSATSCFAGSYRNVALAHARFIPFSPCIANGEWRMAYDFFFFNFSERCCFSVAKYITTKSISFSFSSQLCSHIDTGESQLLNIQYNLISDYSNGDNQQSYHLNLLDMANNSDEYYRFWVTHRAFSQTRRMKWNQVIPHQLVQTSYTHGPHAYAIRFLQAKKGSEKKKKAKHTYTSMSSCFR